MVLISNRAKAIVWFFLMTDRGAFLSTASDIKPSLIDLHKVLVRLAFWNVKRRADLCGGPG